MRLQKIGVWSLAKIFCIFHMVIGVGLGVIAALGTMNGQEEEGFWSLGAWSLLVFPAVNAGLGLITGAGLAWLYNALTPWLGAVEFEVEE